MRKSISGGELDSEEELNQVESETLERERRNRQTDRDRDRKRQETETDRQTYRHTDKQRKKETKTDRQTDKHAQLNDVMCSNIFFVKTNVQRVRIVLLFR